MHPLGSYFTVCIAAIFDHSQSCREKNTLLQSFSPNQRFPLNTEATSWCQHIDMRNFAHNFDIPDFNNALMTIVGAITEHHSSSRPPYAIPMEEYQSSLLRSAFAYYQSNSNVPPNWVYCQSPEIPLKPGEISWWYFVLDSCDVSMLHNC